MKKPKRVLHYSNKVYETDRKRDTKMQPKKKKKKKEIKTKGQKKKEKKRTRQKHAEV